MPMKAKDLGARGLYRSVFGRSRNGLAIDDMLHPIACGGDIGRVEGNFATLFNRIETLATDAMLGNDWIFQNMKCLFFLWLFYNG